MGTNKTAVRELDSPEHQVCCFLGSWEINQESGAPGRINGLQPFCGTDVPGRTSYFDSEVRMVPSTKSAAFWIVGK